MASVLAPGTIVQLHKLRWPKEPKVTHPVEVLGEDDHGLWVGSPAGAQFVNGDGSVWVADVDSVACLTSSVAWNSWFLAEPRRNLYLDIFHSAGWAGARYEFVDLDLDVYGLDLLEIVDIEELELHTELYGYPPELVEEAWTRATEARRVAESGAEPYRSVGWAWLDRWQRRS